MSNEQNPALHDDGQGYDAVAAKRAVLRGMVGEDLIATASLKQRSGRFTEVSSFVAEPFRGYGFAVDKGQSFRFELIDGPQILDIMFLNRADPHREFLGQYGSTAVEGMAPQEGHIFVSSNPTFRPMAVLIRDSVDRDRIESVLGADGQHILMSSNFRCSEGINEWITGIPNTVSCNNNLHTALNEIGGEPLMRSHSTPQIFATFQPNQWILQSRGRPVMKYIEGKGTDLFRRGDHVELLALQDMHVAFSMCPFGDASNMDDIVQNRSWPVRVRVFDTGLDIDDQEKRTSTHVVDFVRDGRPGMTVFTYGEPGGEGAFIS